MATNLAELLRQKEELDRMIRQIETNSSGGRRGRFNVGQQESAREARSGDRR